MGSEPNLFGWTEGEPGRHLYVRQLRDMKLTLLVELLSPAVMTLYSARPRPFRLARTDQWVPRQERRL